jgi:uncharacterized protein involved in exopolysaccharide biosynthesis
VDGSVTWRDVADTVVRFRSTAIVTVVVVVAASVSLAFLMTPIYRSEVLVIPAREQQLGEGLSSQLGQLGALAGLAGIELPAEGRDTSRIGIEVLRSRGFLADFIDRNQLLPILFSADWDPESKQWTTEAPPTIDDGVERFRSQVLKVFQSPGISTIRIGADWRERELAAQWANALVATLNERMRQRAIDQATKSLQYLEDQLTETTAVELRQSIYRLIEEQLNGLMLANVHREYTFEVLDPATPSERPQRPAKGLLILLGVFGGFGLAAIVVALRAGFSRPKTP